MSALSDAYREAVKRCETAFVRLEELREPVIEAGNALKSESRLFGFSNIPGTIPISVNRLIDAHKWPTAQALQAALSECHAAVGAVETAWNNVPHGDRYGLAPPTDPWDSLR